MFIPGPDFVYPGSRIQKQQILQISQIENYFIFELVKKTNWANLEKIIELFTPKIVIKLTKIQVWDPGSNRHRIPDPQNSPARPYC
jgi:hypothetical protein